MVAAKLRTYLCTPNKTLLALPPVAGTLTCGLARFARILAHVLAPQSLALAARCAEFKLSTMLEPSSNTYFVSNVESIDLNFDLISLITVGIVLIAIFKFTSFLHLLSAIAKLKAKYIAIVTAFIWLIAFATLFLNSREIHHIQNAILANQTQAISGCITDHEIIQGNSREEMFFVSGVKFKYNDYATERYFFANREHGTFIKNGQCVTIVYLPNQENGILKIDKV